MKIKDIELKWLLRAEWGDFYCYVDNETWGDDADIDLSLYEDGFIQSKVDDISFEWLDDFEQGQREPILVRKMGKNNYRVLNGHHRIFAAMLLGWDTIKACVLKVDEDDEPGWDISSDNESSTYYKTRGGSVGYVL